jgi:aspartate racemase
VPREETKGPMRKIGIVGGLGWRSTLAYYEGLCSRAEAAHSGEGLPSMPEIAIESLDLGKAISYLGRDDDEPSWAAFDEYHRNALHRLEASGAEVAAIAANAAHHRLASITRGIAIPVMSIFDALAHECVRVGARQALILGVPLIMRSARVREALASYGTETAGPADEGLCALTAELIAELQQGRELGAAERLNRIARAGYESQFHGEPVVCLACTELPLAFPQFKVQASFEWHGVRYVNTTAAHIDAIFAQACGAI